MTHPSRGLAITELVGAALLFGVMAYLTKHVTRRIGGPQAAFVRFGVGVAVTAALVGARQVRLRPRGWPLLAARGVLGAGAVGGYFVSLSHIPVGTATLLHYTAPIWTATFAWWFLQERPPRAFAIAFVSAAAGVVLVVYGQGRALGGAYGWQGVALLSACISGAAITTVRAARRHDGAWEIFAAFCAVGMLCTAPPALAQWLAPTAAEWGLLAAVGLVAVAAQMLMTDALGGVDAATGGIVNQLTPATALLLGHFADDEPFTRLSALGAALTVAGVVLATRMSRARPTAPSEEP